MLYLGFNILPRSVFWSACFSGRSDNTDVIVLTSIGQTLFQITHSIWIGPFASDRLLSSLQLFGITHILNVSDAANQLTEAEGPFLRMPWMPIRDGATIPTDGAVATLNTLHECVCDNNAIVYIHCIAGHHRSPTVLWLYLVSCGLDPFDANSLITNSSARAEPMNSKLLSPQLVDVVRKHGESSFRPHPRKIAISSPPAR